MSLALTRRGDLLLHRVSENAIVVYNPTSKSIVRRTTDPAVDLDICPECGQIVSPKSTPSADYFRLLAQILRESRPPATGPGSPPAHPPRGTGRNSPQDSTGVEGRRPFIPQPESIDSSGPPGGPPADYAGTDYATYIEELEAAPDGISRLSLSQGYFERFFTTLRRLGSGSRATVYLVEHKLEGLSLGTFALKKVPIGNNHKWLEKVLFEVNILGTLSHPNLVRYNHVWLEISALSRFAPPVPCAYVLQEYCDGGTLEDLVFARQARGAAKISKVRSLSFGDEGGPSLADVRAERLRRRQKREAAAATAAAAAAMDDGAAEETSKSPFLSLGEIVGFMSDISCGIAHLHDQGFLHCDLKPSNCLLQLGTEGARPAVLVSDFGESQREGSARVGTGSTGTLEYTAPEMLTPVHGTYPPFSKQSDMFSVGMILHFLCFSGLPYSDAWEKYGDMQRLKSEVTAFAFDFSASNHGPDRHDLEPLRPLLCSLLGPTGGRPSAREVLEVLERISAGIASEDHEPMPTATALPTIPSAPIPTLDPAIPSSPPAGAPLGPADEKALLLASRASPPVPADSPRKRRRVAAPTPLGQANTLRVLKVLSMYAVRPDGWALHGCAALAVLELVFGHPKACFLAHCAVLAAWAGSHGTT